MADPFLGVPKGNVYVENPDGCFDGNYQKHSLYDSKGPLPQPNIPGDYDLDRPVSDKTGRT